MVKRGIMGGMHYWDRDGRSDGKVIIPYGFHANFKHKTVFKVVNNV